MINYQQAANQTNFYQVSTFHESEFVSDYIKIFYKDQNQYKSGLLTYNQKNINIYDSNYVLIYKKCLQIKIIQIKKLLDDQEIKTFCNIVLLLDQNMKLHFYSLYDKKLEEDTYINLTLNIRTFYPLIKPKIRTNNEGTIIAISDCHKEVQIVYCQEFSQKIKIKGSFNWFNYRNAIEIFFMSEFQIFILEEFRQNQFFSFYKVDIKEQNFKFSNVYTCINFNQQFEQDNVIEDKNIFDINRIYSIQNSQDYIMLLVQGGIIIIDAIKNQLKGYLPIQFTQGRILLMDFDLKYFLLAIEKTNDLFYIMQFNFQSKNSLSGNFTNEVQIKVLSIFENCYNIKRMEYMKFIYQTKDLKFFEIDYGVNINQQQNIVFDNRAQNQYYKQSILKQCLKIDHIEFFQDRKIIFDQRNSQLSDLRQNCKPVINQYIIEDIDSCYDFQIFKNTNDRKFVLLKYIYGYQIYQLDQEKFDFIFDQKTEERILDAFYYNNKIFLIFQFQIKYIDCNDLNEFTLVQVDSQIIKFQRFDNILAFYQQTNQIQVGMIDNYNFVKTYQYNVTQNLNNFWLNKYLFVQQKNSDIIQIIDYRTKQMQEFCTRLQNIFDLCYIEKKDLLILSSKSGQIQIYNKLNLIYQNVLSIGPIKLYQFQQQYVFMIIQKRLLQIHTETYQTIIVDDRQAKSLQCIDDKVFVLKQDKIQVYEAQFAVETFESNKIERIFPKNFNVKLFKIKNDYMYVVFNYEKQQETRVLIFDLKQNGIILNYKLGKYDVDSFEVVNLKQEINIFLGLKQINKCFLGILYIEDLLNQKVILQIEKQNQPILDILYKEQKKTLFMKNQNKIEIFNILKIKKNRRYISGDQILKIQKTKKQEIVTRIVYSRLKAKSDQFAFSQLNHEIKIYVDYKNEKYIQRAYHKEKEQILDFDWDKRTNIYYISLQGSIKVFKLKEIEQYKDYFKTETIGNFKINENIIQINLKQKYLLSDQSEILKLQDINEQFYILFLLQHLSKQNLNLQNIIKKIENHLLDQNVNMLQKQISNKKSIEQTILNIFNVEKKIQNDTQIQKNQYDQMQFLQQLFIFVDKNEKEIYQDILSQMMQNQNIVQWFTEQYLDKCVKLLNFIQ